MDYTYNQTIFLFIFTAFCLICNSNYALCYKRSYSQKSTNRHFQTVKSKKNNYKLFFFCIILILVCGLRQEKIADYLGYLEDFQYPAYVIGEPIYMLLVKLTGLLSDDGKLGFLIYAILTISIRFRLFLDFRPFFWGCVLVYLSRVFIEQDMIAIRAGLASSLAMMGFYKKSIGNMLQATLLVILATLSHISAGVFLPLLLISCTKNRAYIYISALAVSCMLAASNIFFGHFLSFIGIAMVQTKFSTYIYDETLNPFNLFHIGQICVCIMCWMIQIFKNKNKVKIKGYNGCVFLKIYTIGCMFGVLFADLINIAIRFSQLLFAFNILVIPIYFSILFKNKNLNKLVIIVFCIFNFCVTMTDKSFWLQNL